jgi:hypothetical protein
MAVCQFRNLRTFWVETVSEPFDDQPQWYWAADSGRGIAEADGFERADDGFVVACGQRELWSRVRRIIDRGEHCAWDKIGPETGKPTLADCMGVFLRARECYGVSYNQLVLEFAQIPAFARMIYKSKVGLGDWVSNPITRSPLPRAAYDQAVAEQLGERIAVTLKLPGDDEWRS